MALDFSTKATMYQNEFLKNRVLFAIMASSQYFSNRYRNEGNYEGLPQAVFEKRKSFFDNAFQNPHSIRDKVTMFIVTSWNENTVEIPDNQLQGIFEAHVNVLAGVTEEDSQ